MIGYEKVSCFAQSQKKTKSAGGSNVEGQMVGDERGGKGAGKGPGRRRGAAQRRGKRYLQVEHAWLGGALNVLALGNLEESCCMSVSQDHSHAFQFPPRLVKGGRGLVGWGGEGQRKHTIEVQQLLVGGLGGKLLGVLDGRLKVRHDGWLVFVIWV